MTPEGELAGIEVLVEAEAWEGSRPHVGDLAVRAAEAALSAAGVRGGLAILLADDARLAELNLAFRSKAGPTNVLSFPAPENPEGWLGDVALAYGTCRREAEAQGKGAVSLDGRLIDYASIRQAQVLVEKAAQIAGA